jgi:hypothetical protein
MFSLFQHLTLNYVVIWRQCTFVENETWFLSLKKMYETPKH